MTAVAGVVFAASNWNTYIRDNFNAIGVGVMNSGGNRYLAGTGVGSVAERDPSIATVTTGQSTTSTTYVNLATVGPSVSVTTGGKALICIASSVTNNTGGMGGRVAADLSGATTSAASDTNSLLFESGGALDAFQGTWTTVYTSLNSGTNTFAHKYRLVGTGQATFGNRNMTVVPF